ncbi:MAG: hypothetical protein Q7U28_11750 [Aquabacterium sp.]|nr:hypothetical protein [Aquabacterium sp.]
MVGFKRCLPVIASFFVLTGCDQLGIETPQKIAEHQFAEAKAIGGACRHALRAIEDCYTLNPKADKSSVFGGWRDMDEYMRENKLDGIAPVVPRAAAKASTPATADDSEEADPPNKVVSGVKSKGH